MRTIDREELKQLLEKGDNVQLVMAYDQPAFARVVIPGSLHFKDLREASRQLSPEKETIVYCTTSVCHASVQAYYQLRSQGFQHIARYAGGLEDWAGAGYRLESQGAA